MWHHVEVRAHLQVAGAEGTGEHRGAEERPGGGVPGQPPHPAPTPALASLCGPCDPVYSIFLLLLLNFKKQPSALLIYKRYAILFLLPILARGGVSPLTLGTEAGRSQVEPSLSNLSDLAGPCLKIRRKRAASVTGHYEGPQRKSQCRPPPDLFLYVLGPLNSFHLLTTFSFTNRLFT